MTGTIPNIPAWIARTKLDPPRLRADSIERPRLLDALAVAAITVTLLSTPTGSGKVTLLATQIHETTRANLPD